MKYIQTLVLILICSCSNFTHKSYKTDLSQLKENSADKYDAPYVIMISIDGFRHDYIDLYQPPFLSSIEKKGFRAKSLEPIFPSKTFPNHYSLITGLYSDQHKLVANRFYDPQRKEAYLLGSDTTSDGSWYGGEPLWNSIKKQGLLTASYFWVGSDANIQNSYPSYYFPYNHGTPNQERTQQIVEWLEMPKETRPHFLTLYFSTVDSAGHRYGPRSTQVKEAVLEVDKLLAQMAQEIEELKLPVNFVIVSDHGMKTIDPEKSIFVGDYLDSDQVIFHEQGPLTIGYFDEEISDREKNKLYKKLESIPELRLFKREDRPKRWHYSKLSSQGDFLLLAQNGSYILPGVKPQDYEGKTGGTHGYDPQESPEMDGIFLSYGPQVRSTGMIPKTQNINLYPYVMEILNLEVKTPIDGTIKDLKKYIKN